MRKKVKIAAAAAAALAVITVIAAFAILYPYAKVSFSGIHMVTNGSTTQGFVDITLKNVDAAAVSYCLEYDTDYLLLSKVDDNTPIVNNPSTGLLTGYDTFNLDHEYFVQNTGVFPAGIFMDDKNTGLIGPYGPMIGVADPDNGRVLMNFQPDPVYDLDTYPCDAVESRQTDKKQDKRVILANSEDRLLGSISFQIIDPAAFSKLSQSQLNDVIKIVKYEKLLSREVANDYGIGIKYLDENNDERYHESAEQNAEYDIQIKPDLSTVTPLVSEKTVTSYEIYNDGTSQDLIDYLNEHMSVINLIYTDTSHVPALFEWKLSDCSIDNTWDPKGNKIYNITQQYNDEFSISVKVTVTAVKLTGFTVDNSTLNFAKDDSSFPQTLDELKLPAKAHPVFSPYLPNFGVTSVPVDYYTLAGDSSAATDLPTGFGDAAATYKYTGHFAPELATTLSTQYPWLTIDSISTFDVTRNVVMQSSDLPKALKATSSVDENGQMTIIAEYADGTPILNDTDNNKTTNFRIKMPNGEVINTVSLGALYSVNIITDTSDANYGKAIITVSADTTVANQRQLAQYINLGTRSEGNFSIAATETGGIETEFTEFNHAPRSNYYTRIAVGEDYEFDYSTSYSSMFPVKAGSTLPLTVTLPVPEHYIATTYDGSSGLVPGSLQTFTVESWSVESGDPTLAGSTVTVKGKLADTYYTNYGYVDNDDVDPVYVTIKYYVVENDGEDKIDAISNFDYDTKQVGYDHDDLQTQAFRIYNSGPKTIYGITVNIVPNGSDPEAFTLTKLPQPLIDSGDESYFEITTKPGLPARDEAYSATVSVLSDNKTLRTFTITFRVTDKPVYNITLTVPTEQQSFGSAKTSTETYTSEAGEVIHIIAEPEADCKFDGWTIVSPTGLTSDFLTQEGTGPETVYFTMPDSNIEIKAKFEELPEAKLRVEELMVRPNSDPAEAPPFSDTGYPLYEVDEEDGIWNKVSFDPVKREYNVVVPYSDEKVKLWFKLRSDADDGSTTVELTLENDPATTEVPAATTLPTPDKHQASPYDYYYDSDAISLALSPTNNIVKLKLSRTGAEDRYYTLNIYRKRSQLAEFKYGNSPYGLIMRDDAKFPGSADKQAAKDAFDANSNTFVGAANTPSGATEGVPYTEEAWGAGTNYDKKDYALFITTSSAFADPGYSELRNSVGALVSEGITKKITVEKLTDTTRKDGSPSDFAFIDTTEITLPLTGSIDLASYVSRIRPDVYDMVYSFTDFDGSTATATRKVIVLSPLGDVNVDNTVDSTDEFRILDRFKDELELSDETNIPVVAGIRAYDVGGLLFKYRVCDTNKDGVVNAVDANNIRASGLSTPLALAPFYKNLE